mmetsp:Transcript_1675/g.5962  ORF Transcript_1675/g.5962 Transcript_1675/m.5962 type:complete len:450 (+) Transcript_1675:79-1428(+)
MYSGCCSQKMCGPRNGRRANASSARLTVPRSVRCRQRLALCIVAEAELGYETVAAGRVSLAAFLNREGAARLVAGVVREAIEHVMHEREEPARLLLDVHLVLSVGTDLGREICWQPAVHVLDQLVVLGDRLYAVHLQGLRVVVQALVVVVLLSVDEVLGHCSAVGKDVEAVAVLLVLAPLAGVPVAVGEVSGALALAQALLPATNVHLSAGERVLAHALALAVVPLALVDCTVRPAHHSLAVAHALRPLAGVLHAVARVVRRIYENTAARSEVVLPRADVLLTVLPCERSLAVELVLVELSLVSEARRQFEDSVAVQTIVPPLALVNRSVRPRELALSTPLAVDELSLENTSLTRITPGVPEGALAVVLAVPQFAAVNVHIARVVSLEFGAVFRGRVLQSPPRSLVLAAALQRARRPARIVTHRREANPSVNKVSSLLYPGALAHKPRP